MGHCYKNPRPLIPPHTHHLVFVLLLTPLSLLTLSLSLYMSLPCSLRLIPTSISAQNLDYPLPEKGPQIGLLLIAAPVVCYHCSACTARSTTSKMWILFGLLSSLLGGFLGSDSSLSNRWLSSNVESFTLFWFVDGCGLNLVSIFIEYPSVYFFVIS